MVKNISITQIHTDSLSCEPLLKRTANGELLCICQCDGVTEPAPENRVYAFHSKDNGQTWSKKESIYPEDGNAVYCTELSVNGDEITAYLTIHNGGFFGWDCCMMKSFDNGYTWTSYGPPPHFPNYTFLRQTLKTRDRRLLQSYQYYPSKEKYPLPEDELKVVWAKEYHIALSDHYDTPYCESGVLESTDGGKTWQRFAACRMPKEPYGWTWSEPTIAELSNGTIAMLTRWNNSGRTYRCDSPDGGHTWGQLYATDIPNPSNKSFLFGLDSGRIALVHTPHVNSKYGRYPLELWISDDDMKTWSSKTVLTDFPGTYSYTDGFYEDGHIHFVIEHNRHSILYFNVTV